MRSKHEAKRHHQYENDREDGRNQNQDPGNGLGRLVDLASNFFSGPKLNDEWSQIRSIEVSD
jgi:hypothetical protein